MTLIKFQNPTSKRFFNNDSMFPSFGGAFDNLFKMDYNYGETLPSVNVTEDEAGYYLEYLVPGFKKEEIKVSLDRNLLTVKAEKKSENTEETKRYTRKEFSYSSFKRSFTLPENVASSNLVAKHENGVLHIELPKIVEKKESGEKEIEII